MKSLDTALALAQTLLQIIESRLELFGVEYRLEKTRLVALIGLACVAAASFILAAVAAIVALALYVPPQYQAATLLAVSGLFVILLAGCLIAVYKLLDQNRAPFQTTRDELKKDAECLASAMKNRK